MNFKKNKSPNPKPRADQRRWKSSAQKVAVGHERQREVVESGGKAESSGRRRGRGRGRGSRDHGPGPEDRKVKKSREGRESEARTGELAGVAVPVCS